MRQSQHIQAACGKASSLSSFDLWTIVGEWTPAPTDCAKYLNGRGVGARYDGSYPGSTKVASCTGMTGSASSFSSKPKIAPKAELSRPLMPHEGIARAIALYDFKAVQVCKSIASSVLWTYTVGQAGDLSFDKGQVITVIEKSGDTNTWWKGKVNGKEGIFPANFVEVV